jgi:hypothetical protein
MFKQYITILMLLLPVVVWASPPDWEVSNPASYDYTAAAVVQIVLDEAPSSNTADRIAFVVNGEVRGVGQAISLGGPVYHFVTLYSDIALGEEMQILVYQAATDQVFVAETTISFQYQGVYGTVNEPLLVNAFSDGDSPVSLGTIDSLTTLQGVPFAPIDLSAALVQADNDEVVWSADPNPHLQATFNGSQLQVTVLDPSWFGSTTLTVRATEQTANAYSASTNIVFTVEERYAAPQWTDIPRQENPPGSTFPLLDLNAYEIAYGGNCLNYGVGPVLETPDPALPSPNWSVSTANADFTTNIIAIAHYTPAFPFGQPGDLLSFWIDGELRGLLSPQVYAGQAYYIGNVSHSAPQAEMEVRVYSSQVQDVYTLPVSLPFGGDGSLGSVNDPLVLDFSPFQFAIGEDGQLQTSTQEPDYVGYGRYEFSAADCAYPEELNDLTATDFCQDVDTDGDGWCDILDPAPLDPCFPDSEPPPLSVQYFGTDLTGGETLQFATDASSCERVLDWRVLSIEDCAGVTVEASLSASSMGGQGTAQVQLLDAATGLYRLLLTLPQGESVLTVTSTDAYDNASSFQQTIVVRDQEAPLALCSDATVQLDETGVGSLTAAAVNNGTFDNCTAMADIELSISQSNFSCSQVGQPVLVSLSARDERGNTGLCNAMVMVVDEVPPVAVCQDITVALDATGSAQAIATAVDGGSTDACSDDGALSLSLSQTVFGCNDSGGATTTLTVTDASGNSATCIANVALEDNIPPTVACLSSIVEIEPDGGYTLQESDVFDAANSFDNCPGSTLQVAFPTDTYNCADEGSVWNIPVTVRDPSGNVATCNATVEVVIGEALPEGLAAYDISLVGSGSSYTFDPCSNADPEDGELTVTTDIANNPTGTVDGFAFAGQPLCVDGTVTVKIESVSPNAYGGVVMRQSDAVGAPSYGLFSNLTNILRTEIRTTPNGLKTTQLFSRPFPVWLRVARTGTWTIGYYSVDGVNFQYLNAAYIPFTGCIEVGIAAFISSGGTGEVVFSHLDIDDGQSLGSGSATALQGTSPSGTVAYVEAFPNPNNGTFTVAVSEPPASALSISLVNAYGQEIGCRVLPAGATSLHWDNQALPAGLYWLRVDWPGKPMTKVLHIQH